MVVQSVIFPTQVCDKRELYFHVTGTVDFGSGKVHMLPDAGLSSYTYMNLFDAEVWEKYTGITRWNVQISISGKGKINLISLEYAENQTPEIKVAESIKFDHGKLQKIKIPFEKSREGEKFYFDIEAEQEVWIDEAKYLINDAGGCQQEIHIGVIICTYQRERELYRNLEQLRHSAFFDRNQSLYGKMSVRIVDNASELPVLESGLMKLYHNPNTGGSGGFTRGIIETRKEEAANRITHVVFMDDDVEFVMESFYRLYALLSYMKEAYREEVVAGRMFRTDKRWVQYTAAEIWNAGDIRHIGWNTDMTEQRNLLTVNDNTKAEYSGWWFACFPMKFVRENTPLPFFLHCDDVEYGLRHGGTPIILNGIQVWHETYEYRQSPVIAYYDMRNALIVNAIYGFLLEKENVLREWKEKISECHVRRDYLTERMIILGMWDFLKGEAWFKSVNIEKKHKALLQNRKLLRLGNAVLWRVTKMKYMLIKRRIRR